MINLNNYKFTNFKVAYKSSTINYQYTIDEKYLTFLLEDNNYVHSIMGAIGKQMDKDIDALIMSYFI